MMSMEDFESPQETAYLLRSPKNAKRLAEGIAQMKSREGAMRDFREFS